MGFMVSVEGLSAPRLVHSDFDSALTEAVRLQRITIGREVRILQEVMILPKRRSAEEPLNFSAVRMQDYRVTVKVGTIQDLFLRGHSTVV